MCDIENTKVLTQIFKNKFQGEFNISGIIKTEPAVFDLN